MILTCPSCSMRYLIADSAIGPEGRTVRCASCAHEWFQEGVGEQDFADILEREEQQGPVEPIPDAVKPIPQGSGVPARPEDVPPSEMKTGGEGTMGRVLGYITAAAIIIALLGIIVLLRQPVVRAWPPSLLLFDMIGAKVAMPGEGLIIDQLKANAAVGDDGEGTLIVRGTVINLKDTDIDVPRVLATLWREDGSTIESWVIDLPYDVLTAEQSFDFEAEYPGVPAEAKSVNLAFAAFMPKKKVAIVDEDQPEEHVDDHAEESHEKDAHDEPALPAQEHQAPAHH